MHIMESSDDDVVGHRVLRRASRSWVVPVVVRARKRSVELGCLSGKEDHCLGALIDDELNGELVELRRDGGERRLELGEPAAQGLAPAVLVLVGMFAWVDRLIGTRW